MIHRSVNIYDANGNRTEEIAYGWDSETNEWVADARRVDAYGACGVVTERIEYGWDPGTNEWVTEGRYVNTFDANGNVTEQMRQHLDSETNEWVADARRVDAYGACGVVTERIEYWWDPGTNEWINYGKAQLYWSEISIVPDFFTDNHAIYPNPFTDFTCIYLSSRETTSKIELFDIRGRIVRTIDNINRNPVTIHRDNLPRGIYLIRIHSDDIHTGKVIVW